MPLPERIIFVEDTFKANLKKTTCSKCGRIHFSKIANGGTVVELCPVCLRLFD
ncbi:TPA: hypothetical protein HA241_02920 [Candidatus Woesearchaeota archaeon]|nr:hypothetical protein [Candidatus Woesearchaeota archaeon]